MRLSFIIVFIRPILRASLSLFKMRQNLFASFLFLSGLSCFLSACFDGDTPENENRLIHNEEVYNAQTVRKVSGVEADYANKTVPGVGGQDRASALTIAGNTMTTNHDVIENQQLRTIGQGLQYDPSIQASPDGHVSNRGFEAWGPQNFSIDGLNALPQSLDLPSEMFESVTVINGGVAPY
ncbi:hypothetical protein FAI41_05280 [Acetobacteraceae bacterium]|nr:hypothetical protein FAI41_05280 [Acetobacteraceae bacterium]